MMTTDEAVAFLKNPQSSESDLAEAWDVLHPLASSGKEPPRSSAPAPAPMSAPRPVTQPMPPPAPASTAAPPAPAVVAAPSSRLYVVMAYGAPVKFQNGEAGPVFRPAPRLEASVFDTRESAETAAATLQGFCVPSVDLLTRGEISTLAGASTKPQARGQRLVSAPPPAPQPVLAPNLEKWIVLADNAA